MMRVLVAAVIVAVMTIVPVPASGAAGAVVGVVLARAGGTLTVLARGNTLLTVIIAGTAAVGGARSGQSARDDGIARASVVEVAGPRNSDGSMSAHTVAVLFDARGATRVAGRIVRPAQGGGLVLSTGSVVALGDDLWIFRGTTLLPVGTLTPGAGVTVYGTVRGGRVVARVIEVSL